MPTSDALLLFAHVALGTLAVLAGAVALWFRKGHIVHNNGGCIFVISMGLASVLGAGLGAARYETLWIKFHAGIVGATLVGSGVLAARMPARRVRYWFKGIAALNALNAAALLSAGCYATGLPDARLSCSQRGNQPAERRTGSLLVGVFTA